MDFPVAESATVSKWKRWEEPRLPVVVPEKLVLKMGYGYSGTSCCF